MNVVVAGSIERDAGPCIPVPTPAQCVGFHYIVVADKSLTTLEINALIAWLD
jgi:hypothetical protein